MYLDCGKCVVRDWRPADKPAMRRLADNRNVWRNLSHRFPHPYTEADADSWFDLLAKTPNLTNWAIEVEGQPAGGIGVRSVMTRSTPSMTIMSVNIGSTSGTANITMSPVSTIKAPFSIFKLSNSTTSVRKAFHTARETWRS